MRDFFVNIKKGKSFLSAIIIMAIITNFIPQGSMTVYAEAASHLVISEVYGGGGNSGSIYKNDFIEIYNPTDSTVSLSNWSVQYASSTGSFNNKTTLSGSIGPHKFYLVKEGGGTGGTINLPTADATGTINLSGTSGKVALANNTISVSGSNDSNVIDFVGYGSANDYETSPVSVLSNTKSGERKDNNGGTVEGQGNGWDTDNNYADFVTTSNVNPQNSSSSAEPQSQTASPVLSNIQAINVTSNSVIITWTTDQASSSIVNYGTTTAYGSTALGNSNSTSHRVSLTGLLANTTYHFAVQSVNSCGLNSASNDYTFTTAFPTSQNNVYNCYFGQLHSHTSNSDGKGTYSAAYTYARDTAQLDFFAITDHSNYFDNYTDWTKSLEWASMKNAANSFNADGVFAAIAGFEMTWSNGTGHMNTFNTDWFESRLTSGMNLQTYYNKIAADTGSISQWNHPGTAFGDFNNFGLYSAAADNVIKLIEVANGTSVPGSSSYFPSYSYYTTALDKGWHVAPSNNQDNHSTNWGNSNDCRTVILAPSLTRANVFNAIRNLRVYASEDKDLEISYSINSSIMGSTLLNPSTLNISITGTDAETSDTISKIELISDGGLVSASKTFSSNAISWNPQLTSKYKYYYVRITEADGDIAVTAPIWTGK
jgi:hypothetical protein